MSLGFINPVQYISYKPTAVSGVNIVRSKSDDEELQKLLSTTQQFLVKNYSVEFAKAVVDPKVRANVKYYIANFISEQRGLNFTISMESVIEYIQTEITEMGVLQPALDDPSISSIEVNGPRQVIAERDGFPVHLKEIVFQDVDHIKKTIDKLLQSVGKVLTSNEPSIDANYRGFRINVIQDVRNGGLSTGGPIISIRKFPPDVFSDEDCISYGNISQDISEFLSDVIPYGTSSIVSGGTNSGKTTQLLRIPGYYEPITRFFCIEDSEEMMLTNKTSYKEYPNIASVIVREHEDPAKAYPISKLVKISLRQNPDVILIGEVRDKDTAIQAIAAANTGHAVHMTVHSNSAADTAKRMLQLCDSDAAFGPQIASSFDLIIYQKYENNTGKRVVFEIGELLGYSGMEPEINPIFNYDPSTRTFKHVNKLKKLTRKLKSENAPQHVIDRWCEEVEDRAL